MATPVSTDVPLWQQSAVDVVQRLKLGEITPVDAIDSALQRIRETEGLNAVITICEDRAREAAKHVSKVCGLSPCVARRR